MTYAEILKFHGHDCPGLAIGYRMACAGMEALGSLRAGDEELVAIVENDACGVDALQCVTGCTFGKGNLIFQDYGKQACTLYARLSRQGFRIIYTRAAEPSELRDDRAARIAWILAAPSDMILRITPVEIAEPEPARLRRSIECGICGESVMESRLRRLGTLSVCIPCHAQRSGQGSSDRQAVPASGTQRR
jgi:formylmethanofuran dehydrogenase subunit E